MPDHIARLDNEITSLAAETLALQTIMVRMLWAMRDNPAFGPDGVKQIFDQADDFATIFTLKAGKGALPAHTVGAMKIIEQLRAAVL